MGSFPGTPKVARGALVSIDRDSPLSSIVVFQYNPATIRRRLAPQIAADDGARSEALRLSGPPLQNIELQVELDAIDRNLAGNTRTGDVGLVGQLASLELLLYPKLSQVLSNMALMSVGALWVVPPSAPLTVLVWGARRVLPVQVVGMSIVEQQFDTELNPVRAAVDLSLKVLTYADFDPGNPGFGLFVAHQAALEAMASTASLGSVSGLLGGDRLT